MCGIGGIVNLKSEKNISQDLIKISRNISHRGTDDNGFMFFKKGFQKFTKNADSYINESKLAFCHNRLTIVDFTSAGKQPMEYNKGNLCITSNSEIYNYKELKCELIKLGYRFKSESDTEVLLASYNEWGTNCVHKFNGVWSFTIYDKTKNLLFASRDRFGSKPYYYYKSNEHYAFCSEIKGLLPCSFIQTSVNREAAFDFLINNVLERDKNSFFNNISELQPGNSIILNLNNNQFVIKEYYNLSFNTSKIRFNDSEFTEYKNRTKQLLDRAINLRLRTKVDIGCMLSGGIDSSSVIGYCNFTENKKLSSYTCKYDGETDESGLALEVANYNNSNWSGIKVSVADFKTDFEKIARIQELPLLSPSIYSHYKVAELAKNQGIKVLLNGVGGDELFGGYNEHKSIQHKFKNIGWYKLQAKNKLQNLVSSPISDYLNNDFKQDFEVNKVKHNKLLNTELHFEFTKIRLKHYLRCDERNTMAVGIESRNPYAEDINLIEYVFNIPGIYKIHNDTSKYLLREAVKDYLPKNTYARNDKQGFSYPPEWLDEIKTDFFDLLIDSNLRELFNIDLLKSNKQKIIKDNSTKMNKEIFKMISFSQWQNCYFS